MKRLLWPLALICCLFFGQPSFAQSDPLPEAAYWSLIDSAASLTDDAQREALANELSAITEIALDNGEIVAIDTTYLVALLRDDEIELNQLTDQFDTLLAAQTQPTLDVGTADATAALDTILAQSQYQYESILPDWLIRGWELLGRGAEYLFDLFTAGVDSGYASTVGWVVAGLAVLGLVLFLWYWLRGVRYQFSSESELDEVDEDGKLISAEAAFSQAESLAKNSDYRQAVRFLYLSTLLSLDERGLLRYDRSKTNREYLRTVAGSDVAETLGSVVDVFDRVWYGFQPIDAASYERYADAVRRLRGA